MNDVKLLIGAVHECFNQRRSLMEILFPVHSTMSVPIAAIVVRINKKNGC